MPHSICAKDISAMTGGKLSEAEAEELLVRMRNLAQERSRVTNQPLDQALSEVAGEMVAEVETMDKIRQRNALFMIQKKRDLKTFARRFADSGSTAGEGILGFLEGSHKPIAGARNSVDYQSKAIHGKYFGTLIAQMEEADVLDDFMRGEMELDIYLESGEIGKPGGRPGLTNNPRARKIAGIIDSVTAEMVTRQNNSGALINRVPGWIARQTHDREAIRLAGGDDPTDKRASYTAWRDFTIERLDRDRTFRGEDPEKFMHNVHEGLYTGIHGGPHDEATIWGLNLGFDIAKKVSAGRVLWFKDAKAAHEYNQAFGSRSLRDQVFSDLFFRSRNIALLENLGPNPEITLKSAITELNEEMRKRQDAGKQVDSLQTWKIWAAFEEVSGRLDVPVNYSLAKAAQMARAWTVFSKLGGTLFSAITDKGFMHAGLARNGISNLDIMVKQITTMFPRSEDQLRFLRLAGVGLDGIIGSTVSRYTIHSTMSGMVHRAQQKFFKWNLMNWWTDNHKAGAGEMLYANLGDHAHLPMIRDVLSETFVREDHRIEASSGQPFYLSLRDVELEAEKLAKDTPGTTKEDWLKQFGINSEESLQHHNESQLLKYVEPPAQRVVRELLSSGKLPIASNAFGPGKKGVWWTDSNGKEGFTSLSRDDYNQSIIYGKDVLPKELQDVLRLYDISDIEWDVLRDTAWTRNDVLNEGAKYITPDRIASIPTETLAKIAVARGLKPDSTANIYRIRQQLETKLRTYVADQVDIAIPTPGGAERRWATMGTKAGTPIGEAIRMIMLFKSFPLTIASKVLPQLGQYALTDGRGRLNIAFLVASTTALGYLSGAIKDALKGRTPKPLFNEDGSPNIKTLKDAALRGGGAGIYGDWLFSEYDRSYRSFSTYALGPVFGQGDAIMDMKTKLLEGKNIAPEAGKFIRDNSPFINLFYIQPLFDYYVFWNLQEMLQPGTLERMERSVERENNQTFFLRPSDVVNE